MTDAPQPTPSTRTVNRTYLDVETTGLDPRWNEIVEIAFVVEEVPEDPRQVGRIVETWHTKVRPVHIGTAHPRALEVNGYTPEAWAGAPTFAEIALQVVRFINEAFCFVGHNPGFDAEFVDKACYREGVKIRIPYHRIDTVTAAYMAWNWTSGDDTRLKLDSLREKLGIPIHPHHTALQDALDCRKVLYLARGKLMGFEYPLD